MYGSTFGLTIHRLGGRRATEVTRLSARTILYFDMNGMFCRERRRLAVMIGGKRMRHKEENINIGKIRTWLIRQSFANVVVVIFIEIEEMSSD